MTYKRIQSIGMLTVLAILSFVQPAFAQSLLAAWPDWITWTAIIMLGTATIIGIAYMIGKTFAIPSWEAFAKDEFANILFTAFIAFMFISFVGVIESVTNSLATDMLSSVPATQSSTAIQYWTYNDATGRWGTSPTPGSCQYPCQFYIARAFLGSTYEKYAGQIKEVSKALATSKYLESIGMGFAFELKGLPGFDPLAINFGLPLYSGRAIFNNSLATALSEFLNTAANLKLQESLLVYLSGLSGIFFVSGLLFRILWFTRKFGGLLIAAGIGIYTIFPIAYALAWYTVDRTTVTIQEDTLPAGTVSEGGIGAPGTTDISSLFTEYDGKGKPTKVGLLDSLGRSYIMTMVTPMIAIFITLGFIRQFSPMIGGDTEVAGLSKLI